MTEPERLTQKEAAARLEISPAKLRRLSSEGVVPREKSGEYLWPQAWEAFVLAGLGSPAREWVSQKEMATRLEISGRQLRRLGADGHVPRRGDGKYPSPQTEDAYEEFKAKEAEARLGTADFGKERARLTKEKADAQEMENRVRRGELIDVRDVLALTRRPAELMARALKSVPARAAKDAARRLGVSEAVALELYEEFAESLRTRLREAISDVDAAA